MIRIITIFATLAAFCTVSLALKENYPFSHFPMYGDPGNSRYYFWLATPEGEPLPIQALTGKSAAQLGKILRTKADAQAKKTGVKRRDDLPQADKQAVAADILAFLRAEAATLKQTLPPKLAIMRTDIVFKDGSAQETPSVWFKEEGAAATP